MGNELISVIIPTYNREKEITASLESVLNQTYDNLEIVVVDDASTDSTKDVVSKIQDPRIKYYRLSENGGAAHARNVGVSIANSEIIAFHDSDDLCMKDRIEKQYRYMTENEDFDLVYSSIKVTKDTANENDKFLIYPPVDYSEKLEGNIFRELLLNNTVDCPTIMMKKDTFFENNGFDETYPNLEDWDFIIRVAKYHKIGFIKEPLIKSVLLNTGLSASRTKFYSTRARIIAENKGNLEREGLFDFAIEDYLVSAEKEGLLDHAKVSIQKELLKTIKL